MMPAMQTQTHTNWTAEWPKECASFWFYGVLQGFAEAELYLIQVFYANGHWFYAAPAEFMSKKTARGVWKRADLPVLPTCEEYDALLKE